LRELRQGDRYLLCSDGLSGVVHEETIAETLQTPDADRAAERLIELALKGGGPDNVTVVIADVVEDIAGLSDTPMVAGAAAEKDSVPGAARLALNSTGGHLASAAEKARKLLPGRRRAAGAGAAAAAEAGGAGAADQQDAESPSDITGYHRIPGHPGADASPADDGVPGGGRDEREPTPSLVDSPLPVGATGHGASDPADTAGSPGSASARTIRDTPPAGTPPIGVDDPDGSGGEVSDLPRRRSGTPGGRRIRLVLGLVLLLVVLLALGLWAFSRTQWYVAESDGRVALYQGIKSRPLGIPMSSVKKTYFPLGCLQPVDESRIRSGYIADSRGDAQRYIDTLQTLPSTSATPRIPPDARTPTTAPVPAPPNPTSNASTDSTVAAAQCSEAGGS
jgi:hypothetical protein